MAMTTRRIANNNANSANTLTFANASFNAPGGGSVATGSRTLNLIGSNTGNNTILGSITNNAGGCGVNRYVNLNKAGTGTWVLAGTNAYSGPTTVSNGTLVVNGSIAAASAVTRLYRRHAGRHRHDQGGGQHQRRRHAGPGRDSRHDDVRQQSDL